MGFLQSHRSPQGLSQDQGRPRNFSLAKDFLNIAQNQHTGKTLVVIGRVNCPSMVRQCQSERGMVLSLKIAVWRAPKFQTCINTEPTMGLSSVSVEVSKRQINMEEWMPSLPKCWMLVYMYEQHRPQREVEQKNLEVDRFKFEITESH